MGKGGRFSLSLVIPAFNEARRVGRSIAEIGSRYASRSDVEVLVVADGSSDGTVAAVRAAAPAGLHVKILDSGTNAGKGAAVRRGVAASSGDVVVFMDADLSTPLAEVDRVERALADGWDVVIGSRALSASRLPHAQGAARHTLGRVFNLFVRMATGLRVRDTQCGFKGFARASARAVFSRQTIDRFAFDVELLVTARRLGLRVLEMPITWIDHPHSTVRPFRHGSAMMVDVIRIALRDRFARRLTWSSMDLTSTDGDRHAS